MNNINHYRLHPGSINYWGDILGNIKDQKDLIDYINTHGGGSVSWGDIVGNINDQEDLQELVAGYVTETQLNTALAGKQNTLVSGENIKTINNESILGSGNIDIQGGEDNVIEVVKVNGTALPVENKAVDVVVPTKVSDLTNDEGFITTDDLTGYATETWVENQGYLTEHQQLKTVNNQSLVGEGNIEVGGLTPEQEDYVDILSDPSEGVLHTYELKGYTNYKLPMVDLNTGDYYRYLYIIDGDLYSFVYAQLYKFNIDTLSFEKVGNYNTYNNSPVWKDKTGRMYNGMSYQFPTEGNQMINVDLHCSSYADTTMYHNIWEGEYGIYQLSSNPQKFNETTQEFETWTINVPETQPDVSLIVMYGVWYDGHFVCPMEGIMYELVEYEDHLEVVVVDEPYFPMSVDGNTLNYQYFMSSEDGLYYIYTYNSYKLVDGQWESIIFRTTTGNQQYMRDDSNTGILYKGLLVGCTGYVSDQISVTNALEETQVVTSWVPVKNVAVDMKSNQNISGDKRFNLVRTSLLYISNVYGNSDTTNIFNLGRNTTQANSIQLTTGLFTLNNIPVATKSDCIVNSRFLPYGAIVSEETVTSVGPGDRNYNFTTHTGRIFNENGDTWYEFDGTQFNALPESRNEVNGHFVVVTPNATFYINGYTYIWNDTTSNFEQLCECPYGSAQWYYWWDGTNLRYLGEGKLVYDSGNDTWSWTQDIIPDWKEGMYHYVNNRVIVLGNDSRVYEYDPINKTYTQLGYYYRWTYTSFVIGGDIIYPYNGNSYYKIDFSKVTPEGDSYITTMTSIPYFQYNYFAAEYEGKMWYFREYQEFAYCYDIEYTTPAVPATDGTYVLKATVVDGQVTYSWEADETAQALQITNEILS